ncbi:hypothetical protein D3C73_1057510 [compost metagenome]
MTCAEQRIIPVPERDRSVPHHRTANRRLDIKLFYHAGYNHFGKSFARRQRNDPVIRIILLAGIPVRTLAEDKTDTRRIRCHLNQHTGLAILEGGEIDLIVFHARIPHPEIPVIVILVVSDIGNLHIPFGVYRLFGHFYIHLGRESAKSDCNCGCSRLNGLDHSFACYRGNRRVTGDIGCCIRNRSCAAVIVFGCYSCLMRAAGLQRISRAVRSQRSQNSGGGILADDHSSKRVQGN